MKISLVVRSFQGGGAQRVMIRLANGLAKLGHCVEVVSPSPYGGFGGEVSESVTVVKLRSRSTFSLTPALVKYFRAAKPDVVISTEAAINIAVVVAAKFSFSEAAVFLREGLYPSVARTASRRRSTRVAYWLIRWIYPFATRVIALTPAIRSDLIENFGLSGPKVAVIDVNPVVTDDLLLKACVKPDAGSLLATLEDNAVVILGVGRLEPQKGFDTLIKAFAIVREYRPVKLMLVGEGAMKQELTSLARQLKVENDVIFCGFQANPFAFMARANVFVLSSTYEGLPNTLIEAVACGATVVSTDCPSGPREILDGGTYGELVPVNDEVAMASAIDRALSRPACRTRQSERGLKYSVDSSTRMYMDVILSLSGNR